MAGFHDIQEVKKKTEESAFTTFSTIAGERINSRIMLFAGDQKLARIYLLTHKETEKIKELQRNPSATLTVLTVAKELDDYTETVIQGNVSILDRFENEEVQIGLGLLAKKSPIVQGLLDSGSLGEYMLLKLATQQISFRVYKELIRNVPKTIIRM